LLSILLGAVQLGQFGISGSRDLGDARLFCRKLAALFGELANM
jgi:hypothetical protein